MYNKTTLGFGALIVGVLALLILARSASDGVEVVNAGNWGNTQVACLPNGHQTLSQHFHPTIVITVDGVPETIPSNIGVSPACMAEAHTHDEPNLVHFESPDKARTFTVLDFLAVYEKPLDREGYALVATLNGQPSDLTTTTLKDGDRIMLAYTSTTASE